MDNHIVFAEKLEIGYDRRVIVPEINFSIAPGKTLALTGINGSGKTTLLKTIAGLLPRVSGNLFVFGDAPGKSPKRIAYLSQANPTSFLLPLRVIDVVRMSRFSTRGLLGALTGEDEKLVRDSMQLMNIESLADKPLNALSGGQRQRVYLSYVLCRNADLVLLDEPTSNLDVPGVNIYKQAIALMLSRGAAVIVATHNIKEAATSDMAMLLAQRVVVYGSGDSVLTP